MKFIQTALALTALSFAAALPLSAQQARPSPHDVASAVIGPRGSPRIIIFYGRPYSKDAKTGEIRKGSCPTARPTAWVLMRQPRC
jgi:hypothetical protein